MAERARDSRQQAERRGRRAESIAAFWLRLKGYKVLAKRVKLPVGEVDLIAQRGRTLAFVEVKRRESEDLALISVSYASWQRISRAAEVWSAKHPKLAALDWRYDLIAVMPWTLPRHLPDFWRP